MALHMLITITGATASSISCPADIVSLNVEDVQGVLAQWSLDRAFGAEFAEQQVDGFVLQHVTKETVVPAAYPNAQPFHWAALWSRFADCGIGPSTTKPAPDTHRRRRRLDGTDSASGLKIKAEDSAITLGPEGDVVMKRSMEDELTVENFVKFCDSHGLRFCNSEGDDPTITSDGQGNVYIGGNVHFLNNVTFAGLHIDSYIEQVFDDITPEEECSDGSCTSCADVLSKSPSAEDGVYLVDGDGELGYDPQYAYCDMDNGGWTLLMRYGEDGYVTEFNFGEATVPTSTGGEPAPTDQIWAPLPSGNDDGHLIMSAFDLSGGRVLKAVCVTGGESYSYTSDLVTGWVGGVYGTDQASGTSSEPVGWAIISGDDIGIEGKSNHYICGSQDYSGSRGFGYCSGNGVSGSWAPHLASISFWPTSIAIGCAAADGSEFELWIQ